MFVSQVREQLAEAIRKRVAGSDRKDRADLIWRALGERWFTNADPIVEVQGAPTMDIGGIRALLLQSLHPLAMAGVAGHSGYQDDPWGRLQRTADYVATTTFARKEDVEKMISHVRRIHDHIKGELPDGRPYAASDPHLLTWVHCAEIESFLTAYQNLSPHPLKPVQCDTYVAQTAISAKMLGVTNPPRSVDELYKLMASYGLELEFSPATADVIDLLIDNPPLSSPNEMGLRHVEKRRDRSATRFSQDNAWACRLQRLVTCEPTRRALAPSHRAFRDRGTSSDTGASDASKRSGAGVRSLRSLRPLFARIRNMKASFHIHDPHSERVFGRWAPCDPSSLRSQAFKRGTRLSLHLRSDIKTSKMIKAA